MYCAFVSLLNVLQNTLAAQGMVPAVEMLRGMAIQDDTGSQKLLKLFNVHQLPVDPADRFRAIFQEQPQWTLPALQAYIEDLQACPCLVASCLFSSCTACGSQCGICALLCRDLWQHCTPLTPDHRAFWSATNCAVRCNMHEWLIILLLVHHACAGAWALSRSTASQVCS